MTADDEATWTPQGPTERLSEGHCWELLGAGMFGRLAVSVENKPLIFPVNYGVQGERSSSARCTARSSPI